jgi:predicted permease
MLFVTSSASLQCPLFAIPADVLGHPWFIATLVDAYWAFITFFVWVAWKEQAGAARVLWFLAIILLGNIAMALYFLRELFSVSPTEGIDPVFTRRNPGHLLLAGALTVGGFGVYLLAWNS